MEKQHPPPYSPQAPPAGFVPPPQPQPHVPHPAQSTATTVIIQGGGVTRLGPQSCNLQCPHCHAMIHTAVETHANTKTHLFALLLCVFGCWPCCCIPYCMDSCQSQTHTCPNCHAFLGDYSN